MRRFTICPRCDKHYLFKKYECSKCGFEYFLVNDTMHRFKTKKYDVVSCIESKCSLISSTEIKKVAYGGFTIKESVWDINVKKMFGPKTTEEDIDRYLLLV